VCRPRSSRTTRKSGGRFGTTMTIGSFFFWCRSDPVEFAINAAPGWGHGASRAGPTKFDAFWSIDPRHAFGPYEHNAASVGPFGIYQQMMLKRPCIFGVFDSPRAFARTPPCTQKVWVFLWDQGILVPLFPATDVSNNTEIWPEGADRSTDQRAKAVGTPPSNRWTHGFILSSLGSKRATRPHQLQTTLHVRRGTSSCTRDQDDQTERVSRAVRNAETTTKKLLPKSSPRT
jgi:hypothetical protein